MSSHISFLTQSRFYSPAFNAAIFDGPLRIYFAQYQEPHALKIYFTAQQRLADIYTQIREVFRRTGVNIFVMLYPSAEEFKMSFDQNLPGLPIVTQPVVVERLGADFVVGVCGPMTDADVETVYARVEEIAKILVEGAPEPIENVPLENALA